MEKLDDKRYEKSKAENEAFWLKCIVDGDLAPDYETAEEIWDSDSLMTDTEENRVFWSTVVKLYNQHTDEYRDELEERGIDSLVYGCEDAHFRDNPELVDENIHHCFACKKELIPVFPDLHERGSTQYNNALIVHFDGGYGMFVDEPALQYSETDEDMEIKQMGDNEKIQKGILDPFCVLICHDCAHDLCDKVPWINGWLDPEYSH